VTRRTAPAAALTAAALILLTACGGGGGNSGSDKIQATQPASTKPSASPSASTTPGVQRPVITFPAYAKNVFEDQPTGDPKKDAVLADNAQSVNSVDDAIFRHTLDSPALRFYNKGSALQGALDYVRGYVAKNDSWAGTTRFFKRQVTFRSDGAASLICCSDESKSWITNPKKTVHHTPATADSYVLYNARLEKNVQGVWQTVNVLSKRRAPECQP
jgi:hypothetical protein